MFSITSNHGFHGLVNRNPPLLGQVIVPRLAVKPLESGHQRVPEQWIELRRDATLVVLGAQVIEIHFRSRIMISIMSFHHHESHREQSVLMLEIHLGKMLSDFRIVFEKYQV